MSEGNGVIRIGRKGRKKFAFGDDGQPFEVDVVRVFQQWIEIDDGFRPDEEDAQGRRPIPLTDMPAYHDAAVTFVKELASADPAKQPDISAGEALDFLARLREAYDDLTNFFHPRSSEERASPDTSAAELRFSAETE